MTILLLAGAFGLFAADDMGTGNTAVAWGANIGALGALILALGYILTKLVPKMLTDHQAALKSISEDHRAAVATIEEKHEKTADLNRDAIKEMSELQHGDSVELRKTLDGLKQNCVEVQATLRKSQA